MCVQVDALRGKVSSLEADLRSSASVNGELQQQLMEERKKGDQELKRLRLDQRDLQAQVLTSHDLSWSRSGNCFNPPSRGSQLSEEH